MIQERIEAAARAAAKDEDASNWDDEHEYYRNGWFNRMAVGIEAADAVMFSDEAIERAAEALYDLRRKDPKTGRLLLVKPWVDLDSEMKPFYRADVSVVVDALKGDA